MKAQCGDSLSLAGCFTYEISERSSIKFDIGVLATKS